MGYEYETGADSAGEEDAPDVVQIPGACPPMTIRYRIYPTADFNQLFGNPPASVAT